MQKYILYLYILACVYIYAFVCKNYIGPDISSLKEKVLCLRMFLAVLQITPRSELREFPSCSTNLLVARGLIKYLRQSCWSTEIHLGSVLFTLFLKRKLMLVHQKCILLFLSVSPKATIRLFKIFLVWASSLCPRIQPCLPVLYIVREGIHMEALKLTSYLFSFCNQTISQAILIRNTDMNMVIIPLEGTILEQDMK